MRNLVLGLLTALAALPLLLMGVVFLTESGHRGVGWAYLVIVLASLAASLWRALNVTEEPSASSPPFLRFRRAMGSICLALFAGLGTAAVSYWLSATPPKQESVVARFREDRETLGELREMILADRLQSVSVPPFGAIRARGITPQRASKYEALMSAADIPRITLWKDGTVHFSVASWGVATRGWRLSIAWSEKTPIPLTPTIDGLLERRSSGPPARIFSPIEGPWYVHFMW